MLDFLELLSSWSIDPRSPRLFFFRKDIYAGWKEKKRSLPYKQDYKILEDIGCRGGISLSGVSGLQVNTSDRHLDHVHPQFFFSHKCKLKLLDFYNLLNNLANQMYFLFMISEKAERNKVVLCHNWCHLIIVEVMVIASFKLFKWRFSSYLEVIKTKTITQPKNTPFSIHR